MSKRVYEKNNTLDGTELTETYTLAEQNIYGSSRLGLIIKDLTIAERVSTPTSSGGYYDANGYFKNTTTSSLNMNYEAEPSTVDLSVEVGNRRYELSNHLGNVLEVVSDQKICVNSSGSISHYTSDVMQWGDYYAYGMSMDNRSGGEDYRFGFNGMEMDNEIKNVEGSSYTTEFRQYDPRVGRWLSLDPMFQKFPWQSPYAAFNNNPIYFIDPNGLEGIEPETPQSGLSGEVGVGVEVQGLNTSESIWNAPSSSDGYTPEELDQRFGEGFAQNFLPKYIETVRENYALTNDASGAIDAGVGYIYDFNWRGLPDAGEGAKQSVDLAEFRSAMEYVVDVTFTDDQGAEVSKEFIIDMTAWTIYPGFIESQYPNNNTVRNPGVYDENGGTDEFRVAVLNSSVQSVEVEQQIRDKIVANYNGTNIVIKSITIELWIWVDLTVIPKN